jgi:cytochrome c-type biogenesis protein CcmF
VGGGGVEWFARDPPPRRTLHGESAGVAFANLLRRNGRRYGGYVVHLGIVLVAVAVATSQSKTVEVEQTVTPGQSFEVAGYTVAFHGLRDVTEPQRDLIVADLTVTGGGSDQQLHPAILFFPNATQAVGSPGIAAGLGDDVYTILAAYDTAANSWATIRVLVIPLVSWLWLGGAVVGLGAVIAALPQPKRREVTRPLVEAPATMGD